MTVLRLWAGILGSSVVAFPLVALGVDFEGRTPLAIVGAAIAMRLTQAYEERRDAERRLDHEVRQLVAESSAIAESMRSNALMRAIREQLEFEARCARHRAG